MMMAQPVYCIQFEMQGVPASPLEQELFLTKNPFDPTLDAGHGKG
jgi:hypothetical protein